nr:immunoglobulin heavy chain junction region [Macaca mulatta]MOY25391.1 immunoglobulin heavy chain junction region [Macaca mulatta]MOY26495.1 immunoglobulin heavy chain junction region [Macaca mulatta]
CAKKRAGTTVIDYW